MTDNSDSVLNRYISYNNDSVIQETNASYVTDLHKSLNELLSDVLRVLDSNLERDELTALGQSLELILSLRVPKPPKPHFRLSEIRNDLIKQYTATQNEYLKNSLSGFADAEAAKYVKPLQLAK